MTKGLRNSETRRAKRSGGKLAGDGCEASCCGEAPCCGDPNFPNVAYSAGGGFTIASVAAPKLEGFVTHTMQGPVVESSDVFHTEAGAPTSYQHSSLDVVSSGAVFDPTSHYDAGDCLKHTWLRQEDVFNGATYDLPTPEDPGDPFGALVLGGGRETTRIEIDMSSGAIRLRTEARRRWSSSLGQANDLQLGQTRWQEAVVRSDVLFDADGAVATSSGALTVTTFWQSDTSEGFVEVLEESLAFDTTLFVPDGQGGGSISIVASAAIAQVDLRDFDVALDVSLTLSNVVPCPAPAPPPSYCCDEIGWLCAYPNAAGDGNGGVRAKLRFGQLHQFDTHVGGASCPLGTMATRFYVEDRFEKDIVFERYQAACDRLHAIVVDNTRTAEFASNTGSAATCSFVPDGDHQSVYTWGASPNVDGPIGDGSSLLIGGGSNQYGLGMQLNHRLPTVTGSPGGWLDRTRWWAGAFDGQLGLPATTIKPAMALSIQATETAGNGGVAAEEFELAPSAPHAWAGSGEKILSSGMPSILSRRVLWYGAMSYIPSHVFGTPLTGSLGRRCGNMPVSFYAELIAVVIVGDTFPTTALRGKITHILTLHAGVDIEAPGIECSAEESMSMMTMMALGPGGSGTKLVGGNLINPAKAIKRPRLRGTCRNCRDGGTGSLRA